MKNPIPYLPLTAFSAAIMFSGSLSAASPSSDEATSPSTRSTDQHSQSQLQGRTADQTATASTRHQANSGPMAASEILGMSIDTATNEKIGEIDEIFIDLKTGKVLAVVLSTGGFLGMGQQQTLIAPADLRFNADRTLIQADFSKEQIRSAPVYQKGETKGFDRVKPLGNTPSKSEERTAQTNQPETHPSQAHGLALSEFIGMSVENRQGQELGKVDEVFLDLENREVVGVVVSTGGFLGIADRKTLFGLQELSVEPANEKVLLDYNRDQLSALPEFKQGEPSVFENLYDRAALLVSGQTTRNQDDRSNPETRSTLRQSDLTVFNQGNSSEEIAMTASIRTAIRDNDSLSSRANNVTIITSKDKVLIRGEVDSASDKTTIEGIAQNKAGRQNVSSELIVRAR